MAELREGVWMRPANLRRPWPGRLDTVVDRFVARPADSDSAALARRLWDLDEWAETGHGGLDYLQATTAPADRLIAAAAAVRHLLGDPVLPAELRPAGWPADALREAYGAYLAELVEVASNQWRGHHSLDHGAGPDPGS